MSGSDERRNVQVVRRREGWNLAGIRDVLAIVGEIGLDLRSEEGEACLGIILLFLDTRSDSGQKRKH